MSEHQAPRSTTQHGSRGVILAVCVAVAAVALVIVVVVTVGVAGGGQATRAAASTSVAATTAASSPPSGPPADGGSFSTPEDIIVAMNAAGLSCEGDERISNPIGALADSRCTIAGEEMVVCTYTDHQAAIDGVRQLAVVLTVGLSVNVVIGQNWSVQGLVGDVETVHNLLGGDLIEVEPSSSP